MQDYASRMKEKFSPKNLAKAFTKKEDGDEATDFAEKVFNRKKPSRVKPGRTLGTIHHALYTTISSGTRTRLRNNESVANVAAKTYNLLLKSFEEKKLRLEISKDFERDLHNKDKIRHENLIKSIKEAKSKQDEVKIDKKKIVDKEPKAPRKTSKKITESKTPPKSAKNVSGKTEKAMQSKTTKAPSPPKPGLSTAQKVGIGTGVLAVTTLGAKSALAANISSHESGKAGYNAYNKGTIGNKMIGSDKPIDFSKMTISEYLRRGSLPKDNPDRLFAVGK
jgi:hypothetical protein